MAWALTSQGIFAAATTGAPWTAISPQGLALSAVQAMAAHGQSGWVIASTTDGTGLVSYTTHDAGTTWRSQRLPGSFPDAVAAVAIDPVDDATVVVSIKLPFSPAESLGYALRSIDGGATWSTMGLPSGEPVSFQTALAGWQAGGAVNQALSRTQDSGKTWQAVNVVIPAASVGYRVAYSDPTFFGTSGVLPVFLWIPGGGPLIAAFFTTDTGGETWSLPATLDAAPDGSAVPVVVTGPRSWIVATDQGLRATVDGKAFSQPAASGLDPSAVAFLTSSGPSLWAVSSRSSCSVPKTDCTTELWLERSSDDGASWVASSP